MTNRTPSTSARSVGVVAAVTMLVGALVTGYGVLLLSTSVLGSVHVAAIGVSLALSGLFSTPWAGTRFGLSRKHRRRLALAFAVLSVLLLVAFLGLNVATFEGGESSS